MPWVRPVTDRAAAARLVRRVGRWGNDALPAVRVLPYTARAPAQQGSGLATRVAKARCRLKSGFFLRVTPWYPFQRRPGWGGLRACRFLCSGSPTPLWAATPVWRRGLR